MINHKSLTDVTFMHIASFAEKKLCKIVKAIGFKYKAESEDRMESDKCVKYKNVAIDLLKAYLKSEQAVIGEYSGDFEKSALELKKHVLEYLKRLDEGEDTFNELVKDMWLFDDYNAESEDKE